MKNAIAAGTEDAKSKEILESSIIEVLNDAAVNIIEALLYLNDLFESGCKSFVKKGLIVTAILIGTHILMLIIIIVIMIAFYLRRLDSEYKRLRTLIGMIPIECLTKDETVKEKFREDFGNI